MTLHKQEKHRDLLRHFFPPVSPECLKWGIHLMRLWVGPIEAWRYVVLDDKVPSGLLGTSKKTRLRFYTLLEKAWVKTAGGFLGIDDELVPGDQGSSSSDDSRSDDSGSDSSELGAGSEGEDDRGDGGDSDDDDDDEAIAYPDVIPFQLMGYRALKPNRGLHYGWQGHDATPDGPKTALEFFTLLEETHDAGGLCCLSGMPAAATRLLGICGGHDYSVLEVKRVEAGVSLGSSEEEIRMVLLRNPWGKVRWKGKYSHLDTESWTDEFKTAIGLPGPELRDGCFWMEIGDAFCHYEGVNIYTAAASIL